MFEDLGLTEDTVDQLIADINLYNFQHPEKPLQIISLQADIDTIFNESHTNDWQSHSQRTRQGVP